MKYDRILLDMEIQRDFFLPGGSCYTKSNRRNLDNIYQLFQWARKARVPVISTLLRVRPGEIGPLSSNPHCIEDTRGEQKISRTVLPNSIDLGLRNTTDLPAELLDEYQQVIFEKRDTDLFQHARAERLITQIQPTTFVICGAGLARSISEAAVGLRSRGHEVVVVSDAVVHLNDPMTEMSIRRMIAKDVKFRKTWEITGLPAKANAKGRGTKVPA